MEYIASFSGGKDSTASVILAHENKEPLDLILFCEVMFDNEISGELPEHIDFIKNKAFPLFNSWGYKTQIIHGPTNYMELFNHRVERTKKQERKGMKAGFPLAARRQGIKTVWVSEIEPDCIDIAKRHFPEALQLGDITQIDGAKIPVVDIISFGSPCQDLSVAGKQTGLDGSRSGLFMEAVRITREMREKTNGQYPK